MSALTPASEVILRHRHQLTQRCVLFAGDLQDALPVHLEAMEVRVHTSYYQRWQPLSAALQERVQFCLLPEADFVVQCNTLIYYWPKSKQEAHFQLCHLLSLLPPETDLFIVGENRSGVRSAESLLAEMTILTKIDSARHCTLWHGRLRKQAVFDLNAWWGSYQVGDICVKTLPGVFSHRAMDSGSQLLVSSFATDPLSGNVLDMGCGSGVLAAVLARCSAQVTLTLSDVYAGAMAASRATLAANQLSATVIASNVYSAISGRFDAIIANPPFHEGLKTSQQMAEMLIHGAVTHLRPGGRLRIVANAFLPYPALLDATFGNHEILAYTGRFKVYQATLNPRAVPGTSGPGIAN